MTDKELEAKRWLVALARKKAIRNGTTLEATVEKWLSRYINEPDEVHNGQMAGSGLSSTPTPQAAIARTVKKVNKTSQSTSRIEARREKNTRSAAYRRLLGVMSDSSSRDS